LYGWSHWLSFFCTCSALMDIHYAPTAS
jgi:hypothetical protein